MQLPTSGVDEQFMWVIALRSLFVSVVRYVSSKKLPRCLATPKEGKVALARQDWDGGSHTTILCAPRSEHTRQVQVDDS